MHSGSLHRIEKGGRDLVSLVTIGKDRILTMNGRRFFPIGIRHMPKGASAGILREAGFNCMRWSPFGWDHQASECQIPSDLDGLLFYAYIFIYGDLSEDCKHRAEVLSKLVHRVRDHPAFLCYEQRNEPAYTHRKNYLARSSPEGMAAGTQLIRQLDQDHPIRVGHMVCNLVSTLKRYNQAVDIVGCNPYVVSPPYMRHHVGLRPDGRMVDCPNQTLSAVGELTTKMMRVAEGRPVWMQIQASSNENWFNEEYSPECRGQGAYEYQKLHPSYWEMRFMAYNAILRGAIGLEWMTIGLDVNSCQWQEIRRVVGELSALQDVLCSPTWHSMVDVTYEELGFSDWTGVESMVKLNQGDPWLLAANTQFDPMQATFSHLPEGLTADLEVVGEHRTVPLRDGSFSDRFQPYEVHVYAPPSAMKCTQRRLPEHHT